MRGHSTILTDEQRAEVSQLWDEGLTIQGIADALDVSREAITKVLDETGVPAEERKERAAKARAEAHARHVKNQTARLQGIEVPPTLNRKQQLQIIALWASGTEISDLAIRFGVGPEVIDAIVNRLSNLDRSPPKEARAY